MLYINVLNNNKKVNKQIINKSTTNLELFKLFWLEVLNNARRLFSWFSPQINNVKKYNYLGHLTQKFHFNIYK